MGADAKPRQNQDARVQACGDYRRSHLNKGPFYDHKLSKNPWDAYVSKQELQILAGMTSKLFLSAPRRCLDFACGTGRVTTFLEAFGQECIGVDVSPGMLEKAKEKCTRTRFLACDLTRESLELGEFDLITAFRFFGNASDELRSEALSAICRYLKPDGYLILNNHRNPNAIQNVLHRYTGGRSNMDLTVAKLKKQAKACRLEIVDIRGVGFWSLRHRWQSWVEIPSRKVRVLERVSRLRVLAPFAPDWIAVLRKVGRVAEPAS